MTDLKHHLSILSIYIAISAIGFSLFALVHFNYDQNKQDILNYHRAESTTEFQDVAAEVENIFKQTYQCLRTIARLPGVRELDPDTENDFQFHGGEGVESNTLLNIQEIYNNLGSNVAVSELYIVPVDMDPDAAESDTRHPLEPLMTFDHLIVGQQGGADSGEDQDAAELEEIEIYEYRLMKKQLAWMKKQYPHETRIKVLNYPMIAGPQVVTCDNSYYDPSAPDDKDRLGLVLSMPYYGPDGKLRGCISAVILTHALKNLLPNGNYAISNPDYDYCVTPNHDGQWQASHRYACAAQKDPGLLVSLSERLDIQDQGGVWSLWLGRPDSDFLLRADVRAATHSRNLAYAFISAIVLTAICGSWLVLRGRRTIACINRGLKDSIRDQTVELETALREIKNQKLAMDEHAIVSITDIRGNILYANNNFCEISGYKREELIGKNHRVIKSDEHPPEFFRNLWNTLTQGNIWRGEMKNHAKDGSYYWVNTSIVPFKDEHGKISQYISIRTDITYIKEAQEKLRMSAEHDRLTDMPNRELFSARLQQSIRRAQADPGFKFAVLFFDFDRFKVINDSLGHNVGDALLIDIAKQFEQALHYDDTAARFGGDEFVVLLNDLNSYADAHQAADRLLKTLAKPRDLLGHNITSTASIGLVTNERGYGLAEEMIRDADTAMYQAKEAGKACVVVFDQTMYIRAMDNLVLESDLHGALEKNQFRLVYQPIVELDTGRLSGFEALLRWDHPVRGTISPLDFIPIAEDTGLITNIGKWVLQTSARQLAEWNRTLGLGYRLSMNVNISKRQLLSSSLLADAQECLRIYQLQPGELKLEVTESTIADDRCDVAPLLRELREHGFPIVMDDFGTGVSSLSALHEYPIDVLKIDQAFIHVLDSDRSLLAVVASITSLAENLGIQTVAEGIETLDIVGALQSIDCTWGQGYYFAKPMNAADVKAYLLGLKDSGIPA